MTDAILEHPREAMRATDPDEAIGRNVKRLRVKCGRTIDDVVKAMQKAGYRWNATTQSNIERGARPLRASEVLPLLRCMGYDSDAEEHIMQVYATPTRNKLDDLAGEMSLTTAKFEDEWCRFIRFRKRMLSILDAESSKDELTISEHDQFGKEYEELSAHMLKLLGSIAADRFGFGHRPDPEGTFPTITDDDDRDAGHGTLLIRQAPELLFLERCIDWLKPGGRIGIVLPKGILDNRTYINYRRWMLSRCKVDAVVTLHKNTFEPDTGVRTCVLFLSKPLEDDPVPGDYTIFMAQSRRVGKDSKGEPVFALDEKGSATSELDEDLTQIAEAYKTFRDIGTFTESETCFTAERGELDDNLNLNPQHYSPELNATLEKVSKFDDKPDWSVTTIGQLDKNIRIYMGPRWSSRSLVVEDPSDTTNLTPYLTANGALEQRRMTVKWFDMSRATDKQKECVRMLRVQKGDILISRSGTIGKVTYATRILADKYVISDDLVRVRVPDENMRAYLLAFLMSSTAMNLMKLDEFGSVQQHLQPRHIWGLPVPVPDSWEQVSPIIDAGKGMISAMEQTSLADESLRTNGFDSLIE